MKISVFFVSIILTICFDLSAQYQRVSNDTHTLIYSNESSFRIAALIGHTLIKSEGSNSHLFIPSWGLDVEYWFSHTWGIGLHNDIEIESFIIKSTEREEIERVNPLVLTIDALYRFQNNIVLSFGPGTEMAHGESYYLMRIGLEYEKSIGDGFDICPAIFYDQRIDGFATYTIALGIGKHF